jgi:hypothetical protein
MQTLPVTIKKTWFGYVVIAITGVAVIGLLWVGFYSYLIGRPPAPQLVFGLGATAIILTLLITIVQLYVYSLSFITLTTDGVTVENWITLFNNDKESFEWVKLTKIDVAKSGIFGQVIGYGTLSLGTSDGSQLVNMKFIPNVEYWQTFIESKAAESTPNNPVT